MIPTSELNPLGQQFERQCTRAWELFEADRFEEANAISRQLVSDPRVGDLHKAGCHMILAHSPDDYVHHAEQAVILFKGLYSDPSDPPNEEQKYSQERLVQSAERVLDRAKADARIYAASSNAPGHSSKRADETKRLSTAGLRSFMEARKGKT